MFLRNLKRYVVKLLLTGITILVRTDWSTKNIPKKNLKSRGRLGARPQAWELKYFLIHSFWHFFMEATPQWVGGIRHPLHQLFDLIATHLLPVYVFAHQTFDIIDQSRIRIVKEILFDFIGTKFCDEMVNTLSLCGQVIISIWKTFFDKNIWKRFRKT